MPPQEAPFGFLIVDLMIYVIGPMIVLFLVVNAAQSWLSRRADR